MTKPEEATLSTATIALDPMALDSMALDPIALDPDEGGTPSRGRIDLAGGRLRSLLFAPLAREIRCGVLILLTPDGARFRFSGPRPGPVARLEIRRWRAVAKMLVASGIGFADAYADGDFETPDLHGLLRFAALNTGHDDPRPPASLIGRIAARMRHRLRPNSRAGSRRNIAFHYDLGNGFYRQWLDETMTYSSACFAPGITDLAEAQKEKYRRLITALEAKPGDHVLELGCGWGGFALLAAREYDLRVTGLTLSRRQHAHALKRVQEAGLADRIDIQLCDYRDCRGQFDHIVSIEMFEAVGERFWPDYFRTLHDRLREGGRAALQVITIDEALFENYRRSVDFIQARIFPGGMLPSPTVFSSRASEAGLVSLARSAFGADYARTLRLWASRFEESWTSIAPLGFDERFRRLWRYYLSYCRVGFEVGFIDVCHEILEKPHRGLEASCPSIP